MHRTATSGAGGRARSRFGFAYVFQPIEVPFLSSVFERMLSALYPSDFQSDEGIGHVGNAEESER